MSIPIRITCIVCRCALVQEAETEAEEIEVGQALLDAALDGGWYDRESDGWYCPRCARDVSRPRVQMNGTDLAGY